MSYGRFRTGDNRVDEEGIKIAMVLALEKIVKILEELNSKLDKKKV